VGTINHLIELVSVGIELLAAAVILAAIVSFALTKGAVRYLFQRGTAGTLGTSSTAENTKPSLGKPLLIALELLVAADVLRTVVLEPTLYNVATLALLILVRTFLSWSMRLEMDGRWPWQPEHRGTIRRVNQRRSNSLQPRAERTHQFTGDAKGLP
jgi:uncharacterized membrane protein